VQVKDGGNPYVFLPDMDGVLVNTNPSPGWVVAPLTRNYTNYYLVEWRAPTKYDKMVATAYVTTYTDADEWRVERVPYNIPGAPLYYRNSKYVNTCNLRDNHGDPPSMGPKYQLLVVDMNYGPMRLPTASTTYPLNSRATSYDAALTLQPTQAITLTKLLSGTTVVNGPWTFPSKAGVTSFTDALGYYAGFYFGSPCTAGSYCYMNADDSFSICGWRARQDRLSILAAVPGRRSG
jgi:immune inhibitor A